MSHTNPNPGGSFTGLIPTSVDGQFVYLPAGFLGGQFKQIHTVPAAAGFSTFGFYDEWVQSSGSMDVGDDTEAPWTDLITAGGDNDYALFSMPNTDGVKGNWNPAYAFKIKTASDISLCRIWLGAFSGIPCASATPSIHYAGFRMEDGAWKFVSDNGSGTPQESDLDLSAAADSSAVFGIIQSAAGVQAYVNGSPFCGTSGALVIHSTKYPAAATGLGLAVSVTALEAAEKRVKLNSATLLLR